MLKEKPNDVLENLWPAALVPVNLLDLVTRLDQAPAAIDEQVEMTARGGSDMALALVLSWYLDVNVNALNGGFRESTSLEDLLPKIHLASRRIGKAVNLTQMVPAEPSLAIEPAEGAEEENEDAVPAVGSALP